MSSTTAPPAPRSAPDLPQSRLPRGLGALGLIAGAGVGLSGVYAATGLGIPCAFRRLFGWDCPFCGGTRMGAALLQGDIATAFAFNPLALIGLVIATVAGLWLALEWARGRRGQSWRRLQHLAADWPVPLRTVLMIASIATMLGWTLCRNLLIGPLP